MMRDRCMNRHNGGQPEWSEKSIFQCCTTHIFFLFFHTHTLIFADNNLTTIRYKESESTKVLKKKQKEISFVSFAITNCKSKPDRIMIIL